jgi:tetratricopeptide (TPR) repeat protein
MKGQIPVALSILLASIIYLAARNAVLDSVKGIQTVSSVDNPLSGISDAGTKIFTGSFLLARYLYQLVLPYPLIYDYSFNAIPIIKTPDFKGLLSMFLIGGFAFLGLKLWLKRNRFGFSMLFFLGSLILFSNIFILIGALYAERFAFFAVLPFSIVLVEGCSFLKEKMGQVVFLGITSLLLLVYSAITIYRNPDWKNNETLYRHDLVLQPNSAKTHYYLGNELIKSVAPNETDSVKKVQLFNEAIGHLNQAVSIYPNYPDGFTQIGVGYYKMNQFDKAGGFFEKALAIDPYSKVALNNLASIRFNQNRIEDALKTYQRVLEIDPNFVDAWLNMGSCYGMLKNYPKAIESFERCLALAPNNEKAWRFMSITYGFMGDKAKADELLKKADSLK